LALTLGNLTGLLDKIRPAVEATTYTGDRTTKNLAFVDAVARKNVELTMAQISEKSPVLKELQSSHALLVTGAMYNIETAAVEFFS
jgi:carbonic anhydrase